MLAKITSKNQITIPPNIIAQLQGAEYFDLDLKDGIIILKPLKENKIDLEKIRANIRKLGLTPKNVNEAVKWARAKK